jgi:hypothetical protein
MENDALTEFRAPPSSSDMYSAITDQRKDRLSFGKVDRQAVFSYIQAHKELFQYEDHNLS